MKLAAARTRRWLDTAGAYFRLMKPEITLLILITVATTMFIAAGEPLSLSTAVWAVLGAGLSSGSAGTLNSYLDRDIDAVMERTSDRPIPAGEVSPRGALNFGVTTGVLSVVILGAFVNWLAAAVAAAGALFYVLVYTWWLKRSTPQNIVIGGAAGAVGPLIGWAAGAGAIELPAILFFIVIFLWTPPHFWALALFREEDYRRAGVPMLPVVRGDAATKRQILVYTVLLALSSLAVYALGISGIYYLLAAVALGGYYIWLAVGALYDATMKSAYRLFAYSIVYLAVLFSAAVLNNQV